MKCIPPLTIDASNLTSSSIAEPASGETAWVSGTFAVGDKRIVVATHRTYQCLNAGSRTISPELDPNNWLDIGPTQRYAMFDTLRNSASTASGSITVVITPGKRIDSIALMSLVGETVTITGTVGGVPVYSKTDSLILRNTTSWYKYFFGAFSYAGSVVHFDVPPYSNLVLTITISRASGNVSCGALVIGQAVYLGSVQTQAKSDSQNYSTVTRDSFGNATLVPRRTVPITDQTLVLDASMVDAVRDVRTNLNAVPAVWSGLDDAASNPYFESLLVLGIYKQFVLNLTADRMPTLNLSLEEI